MKERVAGVPPASDRPKAGPTEAMRFCGTKPILWFGVWFEGVAEKERVAGVPPASDRPKAGPTGLGLVRGILRNKAKLWVWCLV